MMDYDGFVKKSDLDGKYIFWDIDGVLAPFRFSGRICSNIDGPGLLTQEMVDNGAFQYRKPSKYVRRIMEESGARQHITLGKYMYDGELEQKNPWLKEHFPLVHESVWVPEEDSKGRNITYWCSQRQVLISEVVYIDDSLEQLVEAETEYGITCFHVSSLFDWEE